MAKYAPQQQLAMLDDSDARNHVCVVVPLPLDGPFTYSIGSDCDLKPGQFVNVPFGKKILVGVVWPSNFVNVASSHKIKSVDSILDIAPLPITIVKLIDRLAMETLSPKGGLLRLAMSVPSALQPGPQRMMIEWDHHAHTDDKPGELRLLHKEFGLKGFATQAQLSKAVKLTPARVKRLTSLGWFSQGLRDSDDQAPEAVFEYREPDLSTEQKKAAAAFQAHRKRERHGIFLLEGVPGSGKTEVYLQAIAQILEHDGASLVLLPEIALTAQWLQRFEKRFGTRPALWHSGCTQAQRRKTWKDVARGNIKVMVGTRSALFLPFPKLDLIVVDEEHDTSYKQQEGVVYDARLAARMRSELDQASLILVSATPSLESTIDAEHANAGHIVMRENFGDAIAPVIKTSDMRSKTRHAGFIGSALREALIENFQLKKQSMLFLNRRGFAPLMACGACGYRFDCGNCTAWLTVHRYRQRMLCHHCGYSVPMPEHCPECGALDNIVAIGPGVERIGDEVQRLIPEAAVTIVTSDTVTGGQRAADFVDDMETGQIDIVVGTQLVAKGHHFPNLTLVGIVDADAALSASDPRAGERCFQLLYQLAGRAGRADVRGQVIIQTRNPEHPVIQALCDGDRQAFLDLEREDRELAGLPPFGKLAALIISGRDQRDVRHLGTKIVRNAPRSDKIQVLGPAPAPLAMLRGSYRERILIKTDLNVELPDILRGWLGGVSVPSRLRLIVDVDPQSFY